MAAMQRPGVDPAGNDIYTLMLIVATFFVLIATYGLEELVWFTDDQQ